MTVEELTMNKSDRGRLKAERRKKAADGDEVLITKKKIKNSMSEKDRSSSNQDLNEKRFSDKIDDHLENPDEILHGKRRNRANTKDQDVTVYLKHHDDGTTTGVVVENHANTNNFDLTSEFTKEECDYLRENGELKYLDIRRDDKIGAITDRSLGEADVISEYLDIYGGRARKPGPGDPECDAIIDGVPTEIKSLNPKRPDAFINQASRVKRPTERSLDLQTNDVIRGINQSDAPKCIVDLRNRDSSQQASLAGRIQRGVSDKTKSIEFIY